MKVTADKIRANVRHLTKSGMKIAAGINPRERQTFNEAWHENCSRNKSARPSENPSPVQIPRERQTFNEAWHENCSWNKSARPSVI